MKLCILSERLPKRDYIGVHFIVVTFSLLTTVTNIIFTLVTTRQFMHHVTHDNIKKTSHWCVPCEAINLGPLDDWTRDTIQGLHVTKAEDPLASDMCCAKDPQAVSSVLRMVNKG